jgi:hypothetical protein
MDMRQFTGSSFITVESLRYGPREDKIVSVEPGKYDKPVVTFEGGDKLSLNRTNVATLIKAYGPNDDDWIGCTVETYVGDVKYNGAIQDGVLVRRSARRSRCRRRRRWTTTFRSDRGQCHDGARR